MCSQTKYETLSATKSGQRVETLGVKYMRELEWLKPEWSRINGLVLRELLLVRHP